MSTDAQHLDSNAIRDEVVLGDFADTVRAHWKRIAMISATLGILALGASLLQTRTYTSRSSFFPQARKSPAGLSGLAAELGVSVGGATDGSQTPAFYADLLKTRELLRRLALAPYVVDSAHPQPRTLSDLLDIKEPTAERTTEAIVRRLTASMTTEIAQKTGLVSVTVRANSPLLAAELNRRLLEKLNEFNQLSRKSQASAERAFAERRVSDLHEQLTTAEDELEQFERSNRNYAQAPALQLQHERLSRRVQFAQQLYLSLSQSYEQARLEEVRDTPLITIVEPPRAPVYPDSRHAGRNTVVAGFLGALLYILYLLQVRSDTAADLRRNGVR